MSEHLHETFIPGCFRCDLGLDEVGTEGHITIRAGDLRALAAAREENGRLREALEHVVSDEPFVPHDLFDVAKAALAREATDAG